MIHLCYNIVVAVGSILSVPPT